MLWYSWSKEDFRELLYAKYKPMEEFLDPWCLSLPEDMVDERDFKGDEAIQIDKTIQLPKSYSLGMWIYKTSNQWALWACTSLWTTHWVQILNVRKNGVVPTDKNIITPAWKDLRAKMGHSTTQYDWWDYVENAVSTALKEWIYIEENGELAKFDWYATDNWNKDNASIEMMKRYLYKWDPIVWSIRWDWNMRSEMRAWMLKSVPKTTNQWHCIALVGRDEYWMWFINSWSPNDDKRLKSRFQIPYNMMNKLPLNFRYWILYINEDSKTDPEYLKRKNTAVLILKSLKKQYDLEPIQVREAIVQLSKAYRQTYPEINTELPL